MKEKVLNILSKVKNTPSFVKLICFAAISVAIIGVSLYMSGVTVAYNISYGGEIIGQVEDIAQFGTAKAAAAQLVKAENAESYIGAPKFIRVLSLKSYNTSVEDIAGAILDNTPEFAESALLTVNGEIVAYAADSAEFEALLSTKLSSYNSDKYECSSEFTDDVKVVSTYCSVNDYSTEEEIKNSIENLSVKTTVKETTDVKLSYKTVTKRTSEYSVGYYAVTTRGSEGLKHKVDNVVYLNGVEVSRESVEDVVVTQPVNQVVTVGTAPSYGGNSGSLLFPLSKATYHYISSPYGDTEDRSKPHKGVDFAANRGTPIYAAADGTVVEACWNSSGYGYVVTIDHGNGMKTRYAHNSQNLVSVGQTVAKGQTIALVGSTGQSTGYHLHFEITINGTYVNPMNYIAK